jgi:hypothetical protein
VTYRVRCCLSSVWQAIAIRSKTIDGIADYNAVRTADSSFAEEGQNWATSQMHAFIAQSVLKPAIEVDDSMVRAPTTRVADDVYVSGDLKRDIVRQMEYDRQAHS